MNTLAVIARTLILGLHFVLAANVMSQSTTQEDGYSCSQSFTKNIGQWADSILFRGTTNESVVWFTKNGMYYQFNRVVSDATSGIQPLHHATRPHSSDQSMTASCTDRFETIMIKAEFVDPSKNLAVTGMEITPYKYNYFIGNDRTRWRSEVPNYKSVVFVGIQEGVNAIFTLRDGQLVSHFTGSEERLDKLKLRVHGSSYNYGVGNRIIVQTVFGERQFSCMVPVASDQDKLQFGFGESSTSGSLSLSYSTHLGGGGVDQGRAIDVDASGSAYVTGLTQSLDFPTQNSVQSNQPNQDIFLTKFLPSGSGIEYSTYLGGSGFEVGDGLAVDGNGSVYVTGWTSSADFPTQNAYQSNQGGDDAFVVKLSAAGTSILYSTYLGGGALDWGNGIAVNDSGNAFVSGWTESVDYPTANSFQTDQGFQDGFITRLASDGSTLIYSTYLGGNGIEYLDGIAVDINDNCYVTGNTSASNFPTLFPFQLDQPGVDGVITKFSASGSSIVYSTYLGGNGSEYPNSVAVDDSGHAYVMGWTTSTNFPLVNAFQSFQGNADLFVTKFALQGSSLEYSTYIGGSGSEFASFIAIDDSNCAYVLGVTSSTNYPMKDSLQPNQLGDDACVTKLSPSGSTLIYSTYLGGNGADAGGSGLAVDSTGNAFLIGNTSSSNFPLMNQFQSDQPGEDVFVTKLSYIPPSCCAGLIGNVDCDPVQSVDIADLTVLVDHLFISFAPLCCMDEADVIPDKSVDIADLTLLVDHLFISFVALPSCN